MTRDLLDEALSDVENPLAAAFAALGRRHRRAVELARDEWAEGLWEASGAVVEAPLVRLAADDGAPARAATTAPLVVAPGWALAATLDPTPDGGFVATVALTWTGQGASPPSPAIRATLCSAAGDPVWEVELPPGAGPVSDFLADPGAGALHLRAWPLA